MSKTMSIYAEALISNREYKNARIDGESVGVQNARTWTASVKSCLNPAYAVFKDNYDNMTNADEMAHRVKMSALYDTLRPICTLIGEVNGDKINAKAVAEILVGQSVRFRTIDTSNEMAHARLEYKLAKKSLDEAVEGSDLVALKSKVDNALAEVKRLEALPGNCKRIVEMQSESTFVRTVEILLGDAILKQTLRPIEEIEAEKAARKAERDAKRKANKQSKKSAK